MQSETVLRSNIIKSFIKGTIALAVTSLFFQINATTFRNYLIFLAFTYSALGLYMFSKGSTVYVTGETGIEIRRVFRKDVKVEYENVFGLSYSQGMLAKRFHCGTVYVELKKGRGPLTSFEGRGTFALKDVPNPVEVLNQISERLSPFAASA